MSMKKLKPLPHKSAQAICCALLALCALSSACSRRQNGITQEKVSALLAQWDMAQQNHDVKAVAAHLSPKLQYEMILKGFGPTKTVRGDYDQYIKSTESGFKVGELHNSERERSLIAVNADGTSAYVLYEIREAMTIEGRFFRILSSGTMNIEMEDGKMVITSIKFVASPASNNRQPFQSNFN
jgi:ketosteroid isomerase-like protein